MPNSYDLAGKTALITGGAKGIGRAVVDCLLANGASVCVWDRIPVQIVGATADVVDVTQTPQIEAALARHAETSRILISNEPQVAHAMSH